MMKFKLFAPLLLAALVVGCTDSMPAGTSTSPSPSTGTTTTPGGTATTPGAAFFTKGKTWEYNISTSAAGANMSGTTKIEITDVAGETATMTVTSTIAGATTTHTSTANTKNPDAMAQAGTGKAGAEPQKVGDEKVTVPAGTFDTAKYSYAQNDADAEGTVTYWIAEGVGMVKEIVEIKPKAAAPLPGLDLTSKSTLELKSYK